MIKEKISSQDIIDLVASKAAVSKRAAEEFLKVMIATIEESLMAGDSVKIKNFGTFKLQWNEPRKSVNVQSGEGIILAGYYKVAFTPDVVLKEQVNEPFAHLEPVELDLNSTKDATEVEIDEVVLDPLRIFTEQAFEIKNLISEIQGLSTNSNKNHQPEEQKIVLEVVKQDRFGQHEPEIQIEAEVLDQSTTELSLRLDDNRIDLENKYTISETETDIEIQVNSNIDKKEDEDSKVDSELPVTPYLSNITPRRKRKPWILVIIILFLMSGLGTEFYYTYPPVTEFTKTTIVNCQYGINKISEKLNYSDIIHSVSSWFTPDVKHVTTPEMVVIPKETNDFDSISQNQPIDTLQLLFDNPRVYNDFIATEKIKPGNRLTIMSKRYYGSKDYWVYIYEANREQISNPDDIAIGTVIRIPKLDGRLIDPANPRCLKKAKELHDIYIK